MNTVKNKQEILEAFRESPDMMAILTIIRDLGLKDSYTSSRDAMSKYPERCTAVGLRLNEELDFELYVPYGLEDILNFQVRPTPHFLENEDRMELYQ
ncbi:nucleotidyltransferase family protein, partial [Streptococcus pneumoniae]|uniref:nucleotidyltransferase family protein n=1 Tax=Streptococcus pneumoniae TaxID=1313 RepID=UPI000A687A24